jgi:hypothetical protein
MTNTVITPRANSILPKESYTWTVQCCPDLPGLAGRHCVRGQALLPWRLNPVSALGAKGPTDGCSPYKSDSNQGEIIGKKTLTAEVTCHCKLFAIDQ